MTAVGCRLLRALSSANASNKCEFGRAPRSVGADGSGSGVAGCSAAIGCAQNSAARLRRRCREIGLSALWRATSHSCFGRPSSVATTSTPWLPSGKIIAAEQPQVAEHAGRRAKAAATAPSGCAPLAGSPARKPRHRGAGAGSAGPNIPDRSQLCCCRRRRTRAAAVEVGPHNPRAVGRPQPRRQGARRRSAASRGSPFDLPLEVQPCSSRLK